MRSIHHLCAPKASLVFELLPGKSGETSSIRRSVEGVRAFADTLASARDPVGKLWIVDDKKIRELVEGE